METPSLDAALKVVDALESLEISYHLGGSIASTIHGVPRQTLDADLVADLRSEHVQPFVRRLADQFYVEVEMVREAVRRGGSFNLVHLDTGFKIDIFLLGPGEFDLKESERAERQRVLAEPPREVWVKSPEDTILRKLQWYQAGGRVSDRQWIDALGVLRVQGERLDRTYLRHWAKHLGLRELLERLLREA